MPVNAPVILTLLVLGLVIGEALLARRNEEALRAQGAHEASGDVYGTMRIAYPACFIAMGIEGALRTMTGWWLPAGIVILAAAKVLKYWAIATLGRRWSFRVLTLRGAPLIETGPYRYLRHPNYVAVLGELVGMAIALPAPMSGLASVLGFGWLIRRRIGVEERALHLATKQGAPV